MKKFKIIFSILAFSMMLLSCEEDQQMVEKTNEIKRTETINLQPKGGMNAKGGEVSGTLEFTFDENTEVVTDIKMSENLSNYLNLTDDQLELMVEDEIQSLGDGDDKHDHATCIQDCNTAYTNPDGTKKPGRGACKFNCWVSTTVQIVKAVATIVAST